MFLIKMFLMKKKTCIQSNNRKVVSPLFLICFSTLSTAGCSSLSFNLCNIKKYVMLILANYSGECKCKSIVYKSTLHNPKY